MNHAIYQNSYCSLRQGHIPHFHVQATGLTILVKSTDSGVKPMTQQQHEHNG
jgi:hypothetical protein